MDTDLDMVLSSSPLSCSAEHAYACVDPSLIFGYQECVEISCGENDTVMSEDLDTSSTYIDTCETFNDTCSDASDTSVEVPNQRTKKIIKNHHTGPVCDGYITDKRSRQKAASKRTKTLVNLATRLHNMCGAEVFLKVRRETGMETVLSLPKPITKRDVKVQTGMSYINGKRKLVATEGTPQKRPLQPQQDNSNQKIIHKLPGTQKDSKLSPSIIRIKNKCHFCKIIFDSAADKVFRKKNGRKKSLWLGCDNDGCGEWAHAMCAKVEIPCLKRAKTVPFFCPAHI